VAELAVRSGRDARTSSTASARIVRVGFFLGGRQEGAAVHDEEVLHCVHLAKAVSATAPAHTNP
jgi:hypothetical protein